MTKKLLQGFKVTDRLLGLIVPLLVLIIWQVTVSRHVFSELILVPPLTIPDTFMYLFRSGDLISHIFVSLNRVFLGFLVGASAGFVLGFGMGFSPVMSRTIKPLVKALQQVPEFAWMPLIILLFGIDELPKIIFIAIGAFYPMLFNTYQGVSSVPTSYHELAKVFDYNSHRYFLKVLIPSALPSIITGIRHSLGMAWIFVVGAELFGTDNGIGYIMIQGRQLFQIDVVMAALIVIGILGFTLNYVLQIIEQFLLRGRVSFDGGPA